MADTKLFFSHAASDRPLVTAFVGLIEGGIGVHPSNIFCSSLKGQGIRPGTDFKSSIRYHLDEATCVVALLSPNFHGSAFWMCELGGIWTQAKSFLPILVPPLEFGDLRAVIAGLQAGKLSEPADLDELRDEIAERLGITPLPTPRWNIRRDAFLRMLPKLLKQLPDVTPIPREAHSKVLKELADYKNECRKRQAEIEKLQAMIADLRKLKNADKVAAVVRRHSTASEAFESLVRAVKDRLRRLPFSVREALYYRTRSEEYHPKGDDEWDDVQRSIENGQLEGWEENAVVPNGSDPQVRKAIKALDELDEWLSQVPAAFFEWYDCEFEGAKPDPQLRPFWKAHLGL